MSGHTKAAHTPGHWEEQAALALDYARRRPASDMEGFFAALRDSAEFSRRAAIAAATGAA